MATRQLWVSGAASTRDDDKSAASTTLRHASASSPDQRIACGRGSADDVRQTPPGAETVCGGQLPALHQRPACKTSARFAGSPIGEAASTQSGPQKFSGNTIEHFNVQTRKPGQIALGCMRFNAEDAAKIHKAEAALAKAKGE